MSGDDADEAPAPVEVPYAALSPAALQGLVEEFVTRDGTDYGGVERTLAQKVAALMRQLERGEAVVMFDPESAIANIVPRPERR